MNAIEEDASALRRGEVIVMPTDTVYGVAALPSAPGAIRELFALKGRPLDKAIPLLGADEDTLGSVARFDRAAVRLAETFWPGPLTLVLPRAAGFDHDLGGSGDDTIAVRVPASEVARSLLELTGPVAVTSANRSGDPPANTVGDARAIFGESISVYLEGGPGAGSPSTVVSLVAEPRVLREGAVTEAEVLEVLGS